AALSAVLESLGKKHGPEDTRSEAQRLHDALEDACDLLIGAGMLPARAGSSTRADVHIPVGELLRMDGAAVLEDAWLRARAGQPGWLLGDDAAAAACDALIVPVVTAAPDWTVAAEMIYLVLDALSGHGTADAPVGGTDQIPTPDGAALPDGVVPAAYRHRPGTGDGNGADLPRLPLPAPEWDRLLHALGKLAIKFVSGPGAIASVLRTGLLPAPFNTKSVPIDIGYSETIPSAVRRGVIARAGGHCEWPGGCDRPAARCDVHHVKHKKDGGPTSVSENVLFCGFHHDVCVHRWGWQIELRADGAVVATSPDGQVIAGHPRPRRRPPPSQAA
ncbi:MAG TPA: HNH endonuclease signature motif containing protein, partial [Trebonia sp.]|nr:HNH endonuclease signature motif containing protein [Trebonia sp.]